MSKVPLIPTKRPVPQVFLKRAEEARKAREKEAKEAMKGKKKMSKAKFEVHNSERPDSKSESVQRLWAILTKMDPEGDLFVNDKGIIILDGEGPEDRKPAALGLSKKELDLLKPWGVADSEEEDNVEKATGVILTTYQILEIAYELGKADEGEAVTRSLVEAADDDDDDDEEEDFDEEDPDIDVLDEDEEYDDDEEDL